MITLTSKGDLKNAKTFLGKIQNAYYLRCLNKFGQKGVDALMKATPVDTGKTAHSWTYRIESTETTYKITWINTNTNKGVNIAMILQYGHGTRNGGYVEGRDYINPAIRPIFDSMADEAWKEVFRRI